MVSQAGAGGENGDRGDAHGRPKYFAKALEEFPDLVVNLAHLGHGYEEDVIDLCGRFPNLYADMSSRLHEIGDPDEELTADSLVEFIRACGVEHIMFGTNYPLNDPVLYAEVMRTLPLTDDERELVSSGNAKRLLGDLAGRPRRHERYPQMLRTVSCRICMPSRRPSIAMRSSLPCPSAWSEGGTKIGTKPYAG